MKSSPHTTSRFVTYQVVISPETDGSAYNVRVPALPGCFTYGDDLEEALRMAREAIEVTVESLLMDDEQVPLPSGRQVSLGVNELLTNITVELPAYVSKTTQPDRSRARA